MPKAWDEREKELVKNSLRQEGKKLFEKFGVQKTTVDDIVRAVNISKGAFYIFYRSKEELFFDILEGLEDEFRGKIFKNISGAGIINRKIFKKFLFDIIEMMTALPMISQLNASNYDYFLRKIPEETLNKHMKRDRDDFTGLFGIWMDRGLMKKVDMEALNGILLNLFYFIMHRDDFGAGDIDASLELWVDMLACYLVPENNE